MRLLLLLSALVTALSGAVVGRACVAQPAHAAAAAAEPQPAAVAEIGLGEVGPNTVHASGPIIRPLLFSLVERRSDERRRE